MTAVPTVAALVIIVLVLAGSSGGRRVGRSISAPPRRPLARSDRLPLPTLTWQTLRRRRRSVEPAAVAAWCADLARGLRHGSTLREVLTTIVPRDEAAAAQTESLRHRLERGTGVSQACDGWSDDLQRGETSGGHVFHPLATVMSAAAEVGGNTAEPIDRVGMAMRQRASERLERAANGAQARMSARVLTAVPLTMLAVLLAADADVRSAVTSTHGAILVGAGLGLNMVGGWWLRRIAELR